MEFNFYEFLGVFGSFVFLFCEFSRVFVSFCEFSRVCVSLKFLNKKKWQHLSAEGKLAKIGENWRKLAKTGENWRKLEKTGGKTCENW